MSFKELKDIPYFAKPAEAGKLLCISAVLELSCHNIEEVQDNADECRRHAYDAIAFAE